MRRPGAWGMRAAAADEDSRDLAEVSVVEIEGEGGGTTEHKQPSTCTGARRLLSSATPLPCVSSIAFVQRSECGALRTWCGVHLEPADVLGRVSGNCPDTTPPLCPVGAAARCVGEEEDSEEDEARVKAARDNVVRRRAPTSSSFLRVQGG